MKITTIISGGENEECRTVSVRPPNLRMMDDGSFHGQAPESCSTCKRRDWIVCRKYMYFVGLIEVCDDYALDKERDPDFVALRERIRERFNGHYR